MHGMTRTIALLLPAILAGCVMQETKPTGPVAAVPTCTSQTECDAKWAAARTFVLNNAGYKFQTYTADFMETYSPTNNSATLGAQVNKEPDAAGGYRIIAKFWCDNVFGCVPKSGETLNKFNAALDAIQAK